VGNIVGFGYVTATGDITGSNVVANANVTATGNVQGGNLKTAGSIFATGNITGNNVTANGTLTTTNITIPGTATISNLRVTSDNVQVGNQSGTTNQASYAIAIGSRAGQVNQGNNAIAIGSFAGNAAQPANSIILNASGLAVNANTSGFFVNPIRASDFTANSVWFNSNTNELTYQPYIIWVNGGTMGTVIQPVTSSQDLGLVTDAITQSYDLGIVDSTVITGNNIVNGTITGNKLSPSTSIITTGNVVARFVRSSDGGFFPELNSSGNIRATVISATTQSVLPNYTLSTLPAANGTPAGAMVFVTGVPGGAVPAFCDGAYWRSVVDRSIIA
jgi:hypothetical protein